ncbi:MAG: cellulase family glycosylhydrolase [Bacteroidia bacterium]|nr:cellulase family glycosylhydrolase [Bacteroidia bacterium]
MRIVSVWLPVLLLVAACSSPTPPTAPTARTRWTPAQAQTWANQHGWMRGANFIPSTAINQLEMWQAETFDTATIRRELGYAAGLGFNLMRVYLHHKAWQQDSTGFKARMEQYLTLADGYGIRTMFVFMDDCWNGTSTPGLQPAPKPGIHNSGWVQDPGQRESADTTYFPILARYVRDVMTHFATDERIVLWDLYNEPGNSGKGNASMPLLQAVFTWARSTPATQPVTSGVWNASLRDLNVRQLAESDIITFHNYTDPASMQATIDSLRAYERPLLCSEYMARKNGSTFETILPILKREQVSAINWGLVSGKTNTIYAWSDTTHQDGSEPALWFHDIFRQDGTPYLQAEVDLIRRECLMP